MDPDPSSEEKDWRLLCPYFNPYMGCKCEDDECIFKIILGLHKHSPLRVGSWGTLGVRG